MKNKVLAFDFGASSGRAILATYEDGKLTLEEMHRFSNDPVMVHGTFYWDVLRLFHEIKQGILKCVNSGNGDITSIGIDTWGVDFGLLDKDGKLLENPVHYRDERTKGIMQKVFEVIPQDELYDKTGIQFLDINTLYHLYSLKLNRPDVLERAETLLFMPDLFAYLLTGEKNVEYTIASTAQLVNAHTQRLEPELLKAVGLQEENFGRFVFPGEKIGTLTEEGQKITGLGAIPVIAVAGHDTGSAVAAVPALDRNFAYLSSGTWSLMGVETDAPVITAETEALNFTNEGGVEGTIRLLKNICGMWLLERCRLNWGDTSYPELITEADSCEPFRSLINPDDDCFANPADMEQAIREYCRTTGQPVPEQRGQIVRCIFESLALRYRQVLENLRALSPRPIETLHVIGGGSRNDLLNQFTANAIGIPVVAGPSEATAIGNVMIQAMTMGEATDVAGMRQLISRSIPLKTYHPQDMAAWDAAYIHFKNCVR